MDLEKISIIKSAMTKIDVDCIVFQYNKDYPNNEIVLDIIPDIDMEKFNDAHVGTTIFRQTNYTTIKCNNIIFTITPINIDNDTKMLEECYNNCFYVARKNGFKSIAIPIFGFNYSTVFATEFAISTAAKYLNSCDILEEVKFVIDNGQDYMLSRSIYDRMNRV